MNSPRRALLFLFVVLLVLAQAEPAQACSVCFGDPNSNMAKGLGAGILLLLGVVLSVLIGIAAFFVYLAKRSARLPVPGSASPEPALAAANH